MSTKSETALWPQLLIVAATLIWGSSFLLMKQSVAGIPVFFLLAVRFTGGGALMALIFWKKWKLTDRFHLMAGAVLGALMFFAYVLQTYGLNGLGSWEGTTPGKNAFLTATYCVLVPFFNWLLFRKKPSGFNILAAVLCLLGVALVSLNAQFEVVGGDIFTLMGGVLFALHIIAISHYSQKGDVILLTVLQFVTMAILSWVFVIFSNQWLTHALSMDHIWRLAYLTVAATALAMLFQNVGQAHTSPAMGAVLMSLEAPFGQLFAILFGDDEPTAPMYCGFFLIFLSVILSEAVPAILAKGKKSEIGG